MLFPIKCFGCGEEFENLKSKERWICDQCFDKIQIKKQQVCPVCEKLSESGKTHRNCQENTFLSGIWVASEYSDNVINEAIHKLKFNFIKDISFPLSEIMIKSIMSFVSVWPMIHMLVCNRGSLARQV